MGQDDLYEGREQSKVKHEFLHKYLERFAHIIGSWSESITYIDGFSGPWNLRDAELKDSSFSIALAHLRHAAANLSGTGKLQRIRCVFVEKDAKAFAQLKAFADSNQSRNTEIYAIHASFEDAIPDIASFVRRDRKTFAFTFIDPKGWTGFAIERIRPLITIRPGEVLVNLMTGHITRLIETEAPRKQFEELYGSKGVFDRVRGLKGVERIDAFVSEYCQSLRNIGGFNFVCPAFILNPEKDRPHFNLIYATRDPKGVEVFKKAEEKAMELMERERAIVEERAKSRRGQLGLFAPEDAPSSAYYRQLRDGYVKRALGEVETRLRTEGRIKYDLAWEIALSFPLVWETDLREWIRHSDNVITEGLGRARLPKRDSDHYLFWQE
jgi:three-Cys-motif partner protein